jgi:hypothetical protein
MFCGVEKVCIVFRYWDIDIWNFEKMEKMPIFLEIFEKNEVDLDRIRRYLMVLNGWR